MMSSGETRLVAGVLRRRNQVLLCHRRPERVYFPDVWDLPGGHVAEGESVAQALVRELGEELGIGVELPSASPWMTLHEGGLELSVFLVDRWLGEPTNVAVDEHDEIRWVSADDLDRLELADPSYAELLTSSFQT